VAPATRRRLPWPSTCSSGRGGAPAASETESDLLINLLASIIAARYLSAEFRALHRRYGPQERFCLVLRIVEPDAYGTDFIELVADVTAEAFDPPGESSTAIAPDASAPAA
jgi:hypothetical protein